MGKLSIKENIKTVGVYLDIKTFKQYYISQMPDYTIYRKELVGIVLTLKLSINLKNNYPNLPIHICTNNWLTI